MSDTDDRIARLSELAHNLEHELIAFVKSHPEFDELFALAGVEAIGEWGKSMLSTAALIGLAERELAYMILARVIQKEDPQPKS